MSTSGPLSVPTAAPLALPHGTRLRGGAFAVASVLGQGGFGITYKGGDMQLRRYVAIKEFFPHGSLRQGATLVPGAHATETYVQEKSGFLDEARTLARFNHAGIVHVFAVFEENNTAYMVMEFLDGSTLEQLLQQQGGPLPEQEAVRYALQIGKALEEVHRAGLLHRDVKPANVIVTTDQRAVLIDFGTARQYMRQLQRMTAMLTPGYAPLEQYAQQVKRTPATDVYALGATLYHLLTGRAPVPATDRVADVPLPPVHELNPQISTPVAAAVMQALEIEAAKRPQSACELVARLEHPHLVVATATNTGMPARPAAGATPGATPLVVAGSGHTIMSLHQKLERHALGVNALAWSPDGNTLLSAGQDKMLYIWNWRARTAIGHLGGHELGVLCCAYAPHGGWIVSGGLDTTVRLWDAATRQPLSVLRAHTQAVRSVAFSPAERLLASGGDDGACLWDMNSGQLLRQLNAPLRALAFSPDGSLLAIALTAGAVVLWDTRTWEQQGSIEPGPAQVNALVFSSDGHWLATGSDDHLARVWRVATGEPQATMAGHTRPVNAVAFSPDCALLATAADDDTVRLWAAASGAFLQRHGKHSDRVFAVGFAPDGRMLASGSRDKSIVICRCDPTAAATT